VAGLLLELVLKKMPVMVKQVSPQPRRRKHASSAVQKMGAGIICARDVINACLKNLGMRTDLLQQYPRPSLWRQISAKRIKFES
jgi:hypothetical protein